jgi:hypothetical protein
MHDLDRTQAESEALFHESFESGEFPGEGELFSEMSGEVPLHENGSHEFGPYEAPEQEAGLSEAEEMELAAELLEVSGEAELDQFLGRLIRSVGQKVGRAMNSPVGRLVSGALQRLARKLPSAAGVAGTFLGGPAGGALGARLASAAGQMFGLELEGLSHEDQEFEVARRFVRFAAAAARRAARASHRVAPRTAARTAVLAAIRRFAPGLLQPTGCTCSAPAAAPPAGRPADDPGLPGAGLPAADGGMPDAAAAPPGDGRPAADGTAAGDCPAQEMGPGGSRRRGIWVRRGRRIILLEV